MVQIVKNKDMSVSNDNTDRRTEMIQELSEKLELMAVYTCRGSISRIENGKRAVTDIEIDAISKILNVSLDFLFGRE